LQIVNVIVEVIKIKALLVMMLLVLNIPIYSKIFHFIFADSDDFKESVRYYFTPDIVSLFRGKYWKDRIGEFKISIFIMACIAVVALEYMIVVSLLNMFLN